ncbi:hypothetical protein FOA52_015911 [Chlamydomonas sp. UWO 241]|nr:hypothetical protein FOA52_015911 [Chlamydomonas sp. UWO 241]
MDGRAWTDVLVNCSSCEELERVLDNLPQLNRYHLNTAFSRLAALGRQPGGEGARPELTEGLLTRLLSQARQRLDRLGPRTLATLAHCVGALGHHDRDLMAELADCSEHLLDSFSPQGLANTAWAYARVGVAPPSSWADALLLCASRRSGEFAPRELAVLLWALARMKVHLPPGSTSPLLEAVRTRLPDFGAHSLSLVLWAAGTSDARPDEDWMRECAAELAKPAKLGAASPHALSQAVWGLAVMRHQPGTEWKAAVARAVARHAAANALNGADAAMLVYAAGALRLPCDPCVVSAMQASSLARGMAALSPGHMARAAWACARLGARPSRAWLSGLLRASHVLLGQFNARELCALVWGLASLGVELPPTFAAQLGQRVEMLAGEFSAGDVPSVVWALAVFDIQPSSVLLVQFFLATDATLEGFRPGELSAMIWSLADRQCCPIGDAWIAGYLEATELGLSELSSHALAQTLWALDELRVRPPGAWLARAAAVASARLAARQLRPLDLAALCAALGRMDDASGGKDRARAGDVPAAAAAGAAPAGSARAAPDGGEASAVRAFVDDARAALARMQVAGVTAPAVSREAVEAHLRAPASVHRLRGSSAVGQQVRRGGAAAAAAPRDGNGNGAAAAATAAAAAAAAAQHAEAAAVRSSSDDDVAEDVAAAAGERAAGASPPEPAIPPAPEERDEAAASAAGAHAPAGAREAMSREVQAKVARLRTGLAAGGGGAHRPHHHRGGDVGAGLSGEPASSRGAGAGTAPSVGVATGAVAQPPPRPSQPPAVGLVAAAAGPPQPSPQPSLQPPSAASGVAGHYDGRGAPVGRALAPPTHDRERRELATAACVLGALPPPPPSGSSGSGSSGSIASGIVRVHMPSLSLDLAPGPSGGGTTSDLETVPNDYCCPVSHDIMWDPVLLVETGHTYNRHSLQTWFQRGNRTCPKTNRRLKSLLVATNWTLRSLIESWAAQHGIPMPTGPEWQHRLLRGPGNGEPSSSSPCTTLATVAGGSVSGTMDADGGMVLVGHNGSGDDAGPVPEAWTFFQGYDSPGGDLFRLQFEPHNSAGPLMQLLEAADKVPNCIAFHSSGHLKAALQPRNAWTIINDAAHTTAAMAGRGGQPDQYGLYVRSQCLPFIEAGCSSWAADAAAAPPAPDNAAGWTFFPGMDSPGGDICQAITQDSHAGQAPPALTSVDGSITSSSAIALLAMAKPLVVAFNSNGWLKKVLQPMHGWVKWTTEAGKGLFVRNDVLLALLAGVMAHVQGNQLAPVQLAGWTFIQGLDSLGGDVEWCWQNANEPAKLAEEACTIDGVIGFNTNGYIKTALRPRCQWVKVDVWTDKPSSGIYVHNSVLWKLLVT